MFHLVRAAIPAIRRTRTSGLPRTVRPTSTATSIGAASSNPRMPGPFSARNAEAPASAAGQHDSTATQARCCQVRGPLWLT